MLGLQGSTSSSKVYRCVACSATFTGLASLLVHQATHASALTKVSAPPPTQPDISPHEKPIESKDSSSENPHAPALLTESPSPSFYICDCGEEFGDFGLMLEHKHSHVSQTQLLPPMDDHTALSTEKGCEDTFPNEHEKFSLSVTKPDLVLGCPPSSMSLDVQKEQTDERLKDDIAIATTCQDQCATPQDDCKQLLQNAAAEQMPETAEGECNQDKTVSIFSKDKRENLPKSDDIMKLLASAYNKGFTLPESQICDDDTATPKQEFIPVDITPGRKDEVPPIKDLSIAQLRRLLAKPGIKTKAPSISKILDSSRKRIVSLTKTLSPVVVLETRQKLMDPSSNGIYGRYQCGRCRRLFQNMDKLTEHHFLHKKERIKCCRRCKQLIIGKLPFPNNHICPLMGKKSSQLSSQSALPFAQNIVPFHSLNSTKKVFYCPTCKHSYARRYNLKKHKCQGPQAALRLHASSATENMLFLRTDSEVLSNAEITGEHPMAKSIAVGTEIPGHVKVEVTPPPQLAWSGSAKSFVPFLPKSSVIGQHENRNEGQWTVPLDDEIELHSSTVNAHKETNENKPFAIDLVANNLQCFDNDGVKRYPCNKCQRTYSRASTLSRHLRLCGFRPRGSVTVAQSGHQGVTLLHTHNMRPMFPCSVCGKTFNRKDNMMVHRRKCLLRRTVNRTPTPQNTSGSPADRQTADNDGGNWGVMSLPSVLPRRVTCECGVGFTSPRLLLEHLQKHAQESYTCPTCGETVSSWADYEVHLQIHMHPHHQLLKGIQPQRSQPLLLRFQQQLPQEQQSLSVQQPPPKPQPLNPGKKQQRIVCTRCGNTFATRCSLRRHLTWNRCKTMNPSSNTPKTYHCSHCNSNFPNTISLLFHQRSGACKPAIKPVRCPVCLRWFGTVEGLQKHLLTHKQSGSSYRCDVCQGTYPSLKSLKNHRRRIHRIMAGYMEPNPQEQQTT